MERIKYILAGIIMSIFMGCSTMVVTYDQPIKNNNSSRARTGQYFDVLCKSCKNRTISDQTSKCRRCGKTISISYLLCTSCALNEHKCKRCGKLMK